MSKHPHTPGPWILDDFEVSGEVSGAATCRVLEADDFPCIEEGTEADVQAECEANARLIAAAPDMLEALRDCASVLPQYRLKGNTLTDDEALEAVLERVTEIVAKAEGR